MSNEVYPILVLVALLAIFYVAVLRPARRSQQATSKVQRDLAVGDRVVLSAGIFGTITSLEEGRVHLEIAPGTVVEVARQVVVRKVDDLPDELQGGTNPHANAENQSDAQADPQSDPQSNKES